ncbi:MAG: lactate racemase domain-containing protein [Candidatus Thorarchaeota archaeon]
MQVKITYGYDKIELDIPEENLAGVVTPRPVKTKGNTRDELERVLQNPHGPHLEDLAKSKSVCVLVEDHTRDEPHWEMISAVTPLLRHANHVQFIVTTGSHVVDHPLNHEIVEMIKRAAKDAGLHDYRVKIHDCFEPDMVDLGKTSRGTPVIINKDAYGHDVYVALADMKAHYFAGYSNVVKDFLPGVCAFATIEANHAMALDPKSTFGVHPYHPDPKRRVNPLADDMREAMEMIAKDAQIFTLSVVTAEKKLVWADAGKPEPVTAGGIEVLDEIAAFTVETVPRIVVSPGGYPQDKSLYHAQRALELTKNAVANGGEVLFLARCKDGVAPENAIENFYNKLTAPIEEVLESIKGKYHLYEHKAYKFADLLRRVRVRMFTDLDRETVERVHLEKVEDPQKVIDEWIHEDPKVKIMVLDKGNKMAIYAK